MFKFSKVRLKEIEELVERTYVASDNFHKRGVTKLLNLGAGQDPASIQKELLKGRYRIEFCNDTQPYNQKMNRVAQEPVAFHLYKNRHFEKIRNPIAKEEDMGASNDEVLKQFRKELLKLANARIVGKTKIAELIA